MNPDTLDNIVHIAGTVTGIATGLGSVTVIARAIPNYNSAKRMWQEWNELRQNGPVALESYIKHIQNEIGKPELKNYLKESTKEIFTLYNLRNKDFKPKHQQMTEANIDIKWKANMLQTGLYLLDETFNLVEIKNSGSIYSSNTIQTQIKEN